MPQWNVLGAPFTPLARRKYEEALLERFKTDPEGAASFQMRLIERQINKARGLLAFDALLFNALTNIYNHSQSPSLLEVARRGCLAALLSCVPLLLLLFVSWPPPGACGDPQTEFRAACKVSYDRSYLLTLSLVLSIATLGLTVWLIHLAD